MRFGDQIRACVVFFGYPDDRAGKGGIDCIGTGFLLKYGDVGYLVTVKHLALDLGDDPFLIRVNRKDGTAENLYADSANWTHHPDPTVDVSVVVLTIPNMLDYECLYLEQDPFLFKPEEFEKTNVGVGNFVYTLGLFRLLVGEKRNLVACHFGTISMLPQNERVPVIDWTDPDGQRTISVEGYLVESQSLRGLSGAPVFVRPEMNIRFGDAFGRDKPILRDGDPNPAQFLPSIAATRDAVRLLGLWQGAWEARPDQVLGLEKKKTADEDIRVPVGMGIVVPYQKILEVLDMPELKDQRSKLLSNQVSVPAAVPDSVRRRRAPEVSADDANPNHLEDFTRLVDVAARKRPQGDQT